MMQWYSVAQAHSFCVLVIHATFDAWGQGLNSDYYDILSYVDWDLYYLVIVMQLIPYSNLEILWVTTEHISCL